jgi:hypothetical protein
LLPFNNLLLFNTLNAVFVILIPLPSSVRGERESYFIYKGVCCQGFIENRENCLPFHGQKPIWGIFFVNSCNIRACRAIISLMMVGAMAKSVERTDIDGLVQRSRVEAEALSQLYELYYERIFRFCVHRLFSKETAEDVTSVVFLKVAGGIRSFGGRTERDFRNWLYVIAANQANAYIRKSSRRQRLLAQAVRSMRATADSYYET